MILKTLNSLQRLLIFQSPDLPNYFWLNLVYIFYQLYKYTEKYKGLTKLEKDPQKNAEIKKFYDTMINKYNDLFKSVVDDSYLKKPEKDPASDIVYKHLKPNSPYKLSTLMEPKIGIRTFVKYATYNLWNKDDRITDE
jgi:hypothetical protein